MPAVAWSQRCLQSPPVTHVTVPARRHLGTWGSDGLSSRMMVCAPPSGGWDIKDKEKAGQPAHRAKVMRYTWPSPSSQIRERNWSPSTRQKKEELCQLCLYQYFTGALSYDKLSISRCHVGRPTGVVRQQRTADHHFLPVQHVKYLLEMLMNWKQIDSIPCSFIGLKTW